MNMINIWFVAALVALGLASTHHLDATDNGDEYAQSTTLKEAQASQARTARREARGQEVCNRSFGPNSEARWTPDSMLVCTTRTRIVAAK